MRLRSAPFIAAVALSAVSSSTVWAMPGFYAGKGSTTPKAESTQVVVMKKGDATVVSVMPDYKGQLQPFAFVMPVPSDVTVEQVKSMRRDFVDRVDQLSAPRFHEFWEMDPCDPADVEQIWEIDRTAKSNTAFLSGGMMGLDKAKRKVAKELRMEFDPEYKEAEYTFSVVTPETGAADITKWLADKGYKAPEGAKAAVKKYVDAGMSFVVAEVDDKKLELVGGRRAILSPIRYATKQPVKINSTLGLLNSPGMQELFIYVLHPDKEYSPKNYETAFPPTNVEVDFKVKERMGEFYTGLHDIFLAKHPKTFLIEYAWPTSGCGEPCPNEKLMIHELLTLGADFFELDVPEDERNPEPPELTDEEKEKLKALEERHKDDKKKAKEEKQRFMDDRKELLRRQKLLTRHAYVVSRMHHRYDAKTLPNDVELAPASHVTGGVGIPKGVEHTLPLDVEKTKRSKLQTRYVNYHPNKAVIKCENPKNGRWGKPPRTYRGLRKIWVAEDLAHKNRTSISPAKMVKTPIPALGLAGAKPKVADAGLDGGTEASGSGSKCGCRTVGAQRPASGALALGLVGLAAAASRRRRDRR
jgi:MYXO-CTERM domain-containing protein